MSTHNLSEKKMMTKENEPSTFSLSTEVGLITSISLMLFFLTMKLFNLHEILLFRYLNFIFLLSGMLIVFNYFNKKTKGKGIDYLTGISLGVRFSFAAVVPFAFFMGIYLTLDDWFMTYIKNTAEFGSYLNPVIAAGAIFIEGIGAGVITTFMMMQYFKEK